MPHQPNDLADLFLGHAVGGFRAGPRRHRPLVGVDVPVGQQVQIPVEHLPVQLRERQALPAALAENAKHHFGFLHFAYLMAPFVQSPAPLRPVVRLSRSPDWPDVTPATTYGHSVAIGLASLRRSHVHTVIRIERDLGVPFVSLNALTGHRSCAPEDCSGRFFIPPQGPVPVTGVFPAGDRLHLLETRFQVIQLSPYRADLPARRPGHLGPAAGFLACYFPFIVLSDSGKPSDPEISPPIPARCAGDTTVRLMAHRSRG